MSSRSGGDLVELAEAECWELLRSHRVGRVAYDDGTGPHILPFNYQVTDQLTIRFRTTPHSTLGMRVKDRRVAFEVDEIDEERHTGWSVLVRGRASLAEIDLHPTSKGPAAWPRGARPLVVEIEPEAVSGRRLRES
jgi:nitroimidazol reductase NimA-like FMN-containing flavoprotein (pyridoxamine 5'-phosphate oxidase superfamily)